MKGIDAKKLMEVMQVLDDDTILAMLTAKSGLGAGCPGKYKLPQCSCDFITCKTCWKRALRITLYPEGINDGKR